MCIKTLAKLFEICYNAIALFYRGESFEVLKCNKFTCRCSRRRGGNAYRSYCAYCGHGGMRDSDYRACAVTTFRIRRYGCDLRSIVLRFVLFEEQGAHARRHYEKAHGSPQYFDGTACYRILYNLYLVQLIAKIRGRDEASLFYCL